MLTPDQITEHIRPKLIVMQIIATVLIVGVLVFGGVICLIVDWNNLNENFKMLSLIGAVTGILMFGLALVAPLVFGSANQASHQTDSDPAKAIKSVLDTLIAENLIRFVLIEAAIFLNLMVFLIEPHRAALVIFGMGVLLMLICYPRQSKMIAVIEDRLA